LDLLQTLSKSTRMFGLRTLYLLLLDQRPDTRKHGCQRPGNQAGILPNAVPKRN
jgi:hypothetical protein